MSASRRQSCRRHWSRFRPIWGGSSGSYHLSGKVLVPKARIEIKELPASTVAVSSDEIVIGRDEAAAPAAACAAEP